MRADVERSDAQDKVDAVNRGWCGRQEGQMGAQKEERGAERQTKPAGFAESRQRLHRNWSAVDRTGCMSSLWHASRVSR